MTYLNIRTMTLDGELTSSASDIVRAILLAMLFARLYNAAALAFIVFHIPSIIRFVTSIAPCTIDSNPLTVLLAADIAEFLTIAVRDMIAELMLFIIVAAAFPPLVGSSFSELVILLTKLVTEERTVVDRVTIVEFMPSII